MSAYKHKLKKLFLVSIVFGLTLIVSGCSPSSPVSMDDNEKIEILCTDFAQYDWTKNIVLDVPNIEVSLLINNGVDMHSFHPSADDIIKITRSDMIIYTGGQSSKEIIDIINSAGTEDLVSINMMSLLGDALICDDTEHDHTHSHEHISECDEHICLSLKNAGVLCRSICDELSVLDPVNAEKYNENTEKYVAELNKLDREYTKVIDNAIRRDLVFADRYPFKYMSRDYGLTVFAAFAGCSAESDASFETILSLAAKIDELGLTSVLTTNDSNSAIATTVCKNAETNDIKILSLESLQSVTNDEIAAGITYLAAMSDNLEVLREALN